LLLDSNGNASFARHVFPKWRSFFFQGEANEGGHFNAKLISSVSKDNKSTYPIPTKVPESTNQSQVKQ
jgi:hypothetical protein